VISKKKLFIGLSIVLLAAGGGYITYQVWERSQAAPESIVLYGNIDIREAYLAFNISGRIDKMLVEEGDTVEQGQRLASLETEIYDAETKVAKAKLDAQQAALDRLLTGSRPETIKAARANVQVITVDLEDARQTLRRTERLVKNDFATRQKRDDDRAKVKGLEARLNASQQELLLAVEGPRDEDIVAARAQLRATEAGLALAQRRLDYTELHAKARGVVKTRVVEPGAVVLAHTPVYTIAISDPVWVRSYVSEPDLGQVHSGMTAEVLTDSTPDKVYKGRVGFISPVAEFTPKTVETREVRTSLVYRLRIYVKNPDNRLRQGMPVTVRLKTPSGQPGADKAVSK